MASLHPCICISQCGPEVNPLAVVHVVAKYMSFCGVGRSHSLTTSHYERNNDHPPVCTSRQERNGDLKPTLVCSALDVTHLVV